MARRDRLCRLLCARHRALDDGGTYTDLNTTCQEFSATPGFTNYAKGIDSHLDLAAQFLSQQLFVGARLTLSTVDAGPRPTPDPEAAPQIAHRVQEAAHRMLGNLIRGQRSLAQPLL
jgi:hypothetical protein